MVLRLSRCTALLLVAFVSAIGSSRSAEIIEGRAKESETRMRRDITLLASDECEGRGVTTKGINKAADYIAEQFQKAGLKPGGKDGSYFQPFTMPGATLAGPGMLNLTGPQEEEIELKPGVQFKPFGMAHPGDVKGPIVFVGYGITLADNTYDDYKGVDVEGKLVVMLRDTPRADNRFLPFAGPLRREHGSFTKKMQNALKHKAAGILFVNDRDTAQAGDDLLDFGYLAAAPSPTKLPVAHVRREVLDHMLQSSLDVRLADIEKDIDRDLKPRSVSLAGWSGHLKIDVKRDGLPVKNVIGVLEGKGPLAEETVVIGAHYDHLGFGGPSSLAGMKTQAVHHGADDNGSGTTMVVELARRFGAMKNRQGRRLVFMTFSGEESGLLGSKHYVNNPIFPLAKTTTMVNMDMVGRLRRDDSLNWKKLLTLFAPATNPLTTIPALGQTAQGISAYDFVPGDRIEVYGTGTAKEFDKLIEDINREHHFRLRKIPSGIAPSDNTEFFLKKIPVYFFFTGMHPEYHRPTDTADKINLPGMVKVADLVQDVVVQLGEIKRPEFIAPKTAPSSPTRPGGIPKLGIRPGDYSEENQGVLIDGVSPGGAAEKAGMKAGDRIVGIGGKPVKDIRAYMSVLGGFKAGDSVEVTVVRNGKEIKLKAIPE
jgi:hypothetical protein